MKNFKIDVDDDIMKYHVLVEWGILTDKEFEEAVEAASVRSSLEKITPQVSSDYIRTMFDFPNVVSVDIQHILRYEYKVPRQKLLEVLSAYYHCPWIEYDEKMTIPPNLLKGLDSERVWASLWFPVATLGEKVIIAAYNPNDELVKLEIERFLKTKNYDIWVALAEDIESFIQDFLNSDPSHLMGSERAGLAVWRNNMATWRTRLACYRTKYAKVRTHFNLQRGGLSLIAIARLLMSSHDSTELQYLYWGMIILGLLLVLLGLYSYWDLRNFGVKSPKPNILMKVTGVTLEFFKNFQFVHKDTVISSNEPKTLLNKLLISLKNIYVYIDPSPDNKVRSELAHERNYFASQRTIASCYRTIYAAGRTGLSFMRSGIAFVSVGLGLIVHFGFGKMSALDIFIIVQGAWMFVDGVIWYIPVRKIGRFSVADIPPKLRRAEL